MNASERGPPIKCTELIEPYIYSWHHLTYSTELYRISPNRSASTQATSDLTEISLSDKGDITEDSRHLLKYSSYPNDFPDGDIAGKWCSSSFSTITTN